MITIIANCHVATVDAAGTEYSSGHVAFDEDGIILVGEGMPPKMGGESRIVDGRGLLVTPGLVNTHHHLYQWITRGYATDHTLFEWLATLYPVWARLTPELVHDSAAANLAWLALTGCSMSTDHHYVHPTGGQLEATIEAAGEIGLRFHPTRGSMNLGQSDGGLPPDEVVEQHDAILAATAEAIDRWHDPAREAMLRIAVAPCSPFSVTAELMRDSAALAREKGVRLHTHLAETTDEEKYCQETFGRTPAELADGLGWLAPDVWLAHCVHLAPAAIDRFAATGTAVAHCPTSNGRLGAGIAPVRALRSAGVAVGLGVDGAASNESGRMVDELQQSALAARYVGGPTALAARVALEMGTMGGARCLGREGELGSIEAGKLADLALWRVDDLGGAGIADPVCTLVLGAARLERLYVNGREIVADGELQTADAAELAHRAATASEAIA